MYGKVKQRYDERVVQLDCMQGQPWVVGSPLHIPRWGASSAWRTTSSNSVLDIFAETNWSSASKYDFAFAPRATLSCPLMVDVDESDMGSWEF